MTDQLTTEDDLRAALLSRAPLDLDVTDFRARLDRMIGGTPVGTTAVATDAGPAGPEPDAIGPAAGAIDLDAAVIPLTPSVRARRGTRARIGIALTAAACVAAIVGLVLAVLPGNNGGTHNATDQVPFDVRSQLLPGTIVIGTYRGTGSRDIEVPHRTVPKYFTYAVYASCSGGKDFEVLGAAVKPACSDTGLFGTTGTPSNGAIPVRTGAATSWQVTVVIEPQLRTNGSVQSPVDQNIMSGPDNGLRHSGTGTDTVHLDGAGSGAPVSTRYTVNLVCHGDGVSLPGLVDRSGTRGLDTRTCFGGRQYVWSDVRLTLPADIRVVASVGTSWTIYLDPA